MRQILFRGKRVDNMKWAYGSMVKKEVPIFKDEIEVQYHIVDKTGASFEVFEEHLGQYTGLKDKNGKINVFEGDKYKTQILMGHPESRYGGTFWVPVECVVSFKDGKFCGRALTETIEYVGHTFKPRHLNFISLPKDIEITGSIHDTESSEGE